MPETCQPDPIAEAWRINALMSMNVLSPAIFAQLDIEGKFLPAKIAVRAECAGRQADFIPEAEIISA